MITTKEKPLLKLEIDETVMPTDIYNDNTISDLQGVEFEIINPIDYSDKRRVEINKEINAIDDRLSIINEKVEEINAEIDRLTNHADCIDYTIAVASGILTGIIDSIWVGEFSIERANEWGNEKVNNFVVKIAQKQGYSGDNLDGVIKHLEDKFPIAADQAKNDFGGGLQHHLRDFSHHPTPVGLLFSLLTQFTGNVYGTDVFGKFKVVPTNGELIGKNLHEKLTFGIINWFFHMVSDLAGSSESVRNGKFGTGLPGPIVAFLKEISALPIFRKMDANGYKEFSVWISKLFNGTLLGKRDETGKLIETVKFDLRTEIGIFHELGRQSVPVIINECIVRGFYFVRRLYDEINNNDIKSISELKKVNWKSTLPFKNRTIIRMLTIATGTFTAIDLADAGIRAVVKSGGINPTALGNFILRVNFVGIGRFAIAVTTDVGMGIKKSKKENERIILKGEQLELLNAKLFYKQGDMWIKAEKTDEALKETYIIMNNTAFEFAKAWNETAEGSERRKDYENNIRESHPEFSKELSDFIKYY